MNTPMDTALYSNLNSVQQNIRTRVSSSSRSMPTSPTTRKQPHGLFTPTSLTPSTSAQTFQEQHQPSTLPHLTQPLITPSLPASPSSSSRISLDMKRLLAKPAPPYARTYHGSGSESEGGGTYSFSDGGGKTKSRSRHDKVQGPSRRDIHAMHEFSFDRPVPLDLSLESHGNSSKMDLESSPSSRLRVKSESGRGQRISEQQKEKEAKGGRVRNVLRRRPSTMTVSSKDPPALSASHPSSHSVSPQPSALHSPLPPISPPSPLTPSMLPISSPLPSPALPRPTTAPSSQPNDSRGTTQMKGATTLNVTRSVSTSALVPRASSVQLQPNITRSSNTIRRERDHSPNTHARGGNGTLQDNKARPKGSPFTPSSSSSPSHSLTRSHSPTSPPAYRSHLLSSLASNIRSTLGASNSPSPSPSPNADKARNQQQQYTSRQRQNPPIDSAPDGVGLTPAAAVAAAYKRQASMQETVSTSVVGMPHAEPVGAAAVAPAAAKYESLFTPEKRSARAGISLDEGVTRARKNAATAATTHRGPKELIGGGQTAEGDELRRFASSGDRRVVTDPGVVVDKDETGQPATTPYYTVYGSITGRVVAVGGPDDHDHLSWDLSPPSSSASFGLSSSLGSLGRRSTVTAGTSSGWKTPTRKRSKQLKRTGDASASEGERGVEQGNARRGMGSNTDWEKDGRDFLMGQRRRAKEGLTRGTKHLSTASLGGNHHRRSLRLSIDKFPDDLRILGRERNWETEVPATLGSGSSTPSSPWQHRRLKSSSKDKDNHSPSSTNTPSASPNSTTSGTGLKLWKLMKRISTGGLREKYATPQEGMVAPPVPALPKYYPMYPGSVAKSPGDADSSATYNSPPNSGQSSSSPVRPPELPLGKTVRKKASLILGIGTTITSPKSPNTRLPPVAVSNNTQPYTLPTSNARPSTTTRSSSPNSSDVASARFFPGCGYKQTTSAHSSTSSLLVEEVPPMPKLIKMTGVANHIIPPSELGRIHSNNDGYVDKEELTVQPLQTPQQYEDLNFRHQKQHSTQNFARKLKLVVPSSPPHLKDDEWVVVHTPALELTSLPLPPRRAVSTNRIRSDANTPTPNTSWSGASLLDLYSAPGMEKQEWEAMWGGENEKLDEYLEGDRSGSPIIPSFSTADPINAFPPKRTSTDTRPPISISTPPSPPQYSTESQPASPLNPPPRPSRSSQRPAPGGSSRSTPTSPIASSLTSHAPRPQVHDNKGTNLNTNRFSTGGQSTTSTVTITNNTRRQSSSSYLSSSLPSSVTPRRALTFRELGRSKPDATLTEQEKTARWDDLLEKSAEAGGTLQYGGRW